MAEKSVLFDHLGAAMNAGADIFLPKPLSSISAFQTTILGLLPSASRPRHVAFPVEDHVEPDPIAMKDDLSLAVDLLMTDPDGRSLDYLAAFLKSLASAAGAEGQEPRRGRLEAEEPVQGAQRRRVAVQHPQEVQARRASALHQRVQPGHAGEDH